MKLSLNKVHIKIMINVHSLPPEHRNLIPLESIVCKEIDAILSLPALHV